MLNETISHATFEERKSQTLKRAWLSVLHISSQMCNSNLASFLEQFSISHHYL